MRAERIAGLVLAAAVIAGCGPGTPELDVRTFELRHLDPESAARTIDPYVFADREGAPGNFNIDSETGTITVRETPDNLAKIERVLNQLDRPEPGVTLRFQIIEADGTGDSDPAIAEVVAELKKLFRYRGYELVADGLVRARDDESFSQMFAGETEALSLHGTLSNVRLTDADGALTLAFELISSRYGEVLETSVDVRTGQTVVLGTTHRENRALILTVRAELEGS